MPLKRLLGEYFNQEIGVNMFKSLKGLAVPSEKKLRTDLIQELAQFDDLLLGLAGDTLASEDVNDSDLLMRVLPSGKRVYCPNRQNPVRNRKHHVRSLLIH